MFESTQGDSGYDIAKTNVPDNVNSLIGDANTLSDPNASHSLALNNQEDKTFEDILYQYFFCTHVKRMQNETIK